MEEKLNQARAALGAAIAAHERAYTAMVAAQGKDGTAEAFMAAGSAMQRAQDAVARLSPPPSYSHASQWHHKRSNRGNRR